MKDDNNKINSGVGGSTDSQTSPTMGTEVIIDADSAVFGRLASSAAKNLLKGKAVIIVNAEKSIITGNRKFIKAKVLHKRQRGDVKKGPFYPRYPDDMLRRAIRGMMPYKKAKGMSAMRRLKIFIDCPKEFEGKGKKTIKTKEDLECRFMTLKEVSKFLGAKI